jgi:hypothetical protein
VRINAIILLWALSATNRSHAMANDSPSGKATRQDTTATAVREDLRILDTIRVAPPLRPSKDAQGIRLGADTVVVVEMMSFPPFAYRSDQVVEGQPASRGMRVNASVLGRDTSRRQLNFRRLSYANCPLELQLFRRAARMTRPAWSSRAAPDSLACPRRDPISDVLMVWWPVPEILGDSLHADWYSLAVSVRLQDGRVLRAQKDSVYLTADLTPATHALAAFDFRPSIAVTGVGPRKLEAKVAAKNISRGLAELDFGSCSAHVKLYSPAMGSSSEPVWNSDLREPRRRPGVQHSGYGCTAELRTRTLAPGESQDFGFGAPLAEVLADTLPFGVYRATIFLELVNQRVSQERWPGGRTFDMGNLTISPSPDSLPRSRTIDGLRFTAGARVVRGKQPDDDTVRTTVLVTNDTRRQRTFRVPRDCPISVAGYRSTADRDSLPAGNPVWSGQRSICYLYPQAIELAPGERIAIQAEKPVREINAADRAGRHFLAIWINGEPWVSLSAGAVELR